MEFHSRKKPGSHHIGDGVRMSHIPIMNARLKREIAKLSLEERLELFETLWDDSEDVLVVPTLSSEQKALLDARYDDHLRNPDAPTKTLQQIAAELGVKL
jgi:putative addiction module component (TIGR02574 family)